MTHEELLKIAEEITDKLEPLILNATFQDSPPSRMATNLVLTTLELHIGVLTLLRSYASSHAPILIRSMQESFISLKCLSDDPLYLNQIHHDDALKISQIYEGMIKASKTDDPELEDFRTQRDKQLSIVKTHADHGIKHRSIEWRFKKADLAVEYITYGILCTVSHNIATTLYARHGTGTELDFARELPKITFKAFLKQSLSFLSRSIELIPAFSNASPQLIDETIKSISAKFSQFD